MVASSDSQIFNPGDSVEAIAFDPVNYRVVTTSHQGKIKMFRLEKDGKAKWRIHVLENKLTCCQSSELLLLWTIDQIEAIARSAHFVNRGEEVVVYALESGEV